MKWAIIISLLLSLAFAIVWEYGFALLGIPASISSFCFDFICVFPGTAFLGIVIVKLWSLKG